MTPFSTERKSCQWLWQGGPPKHAKSKKPDPECTAGARLCGILERVNCRVGRKQMVVVGGQRGAGEPAASGHEETFTFREWGNGLKCPREGASL